MIKNAKIIAVNASPFDYHQQKVEDRGLPHYTMSSSDLRLFAQCPSKWKHGYTLSESSSLEYGSLFDCLVLTPERFNESYSMQPSTYMKKVLKCPKCGSETDSKSCRKCGVERNEVESEHPWSNASDTCRAWVDEQLKAGRRIVTNGELADAQAAKNRLLADEQCRLFIEACQKQVWVAAEWHDEATGLIVPIKCLIDLASKGDSLFPKALGDLKTTKNASIQSWARWAHTVGYDVQAAWNTDLFVAATKREITEFCFVLSENSFPWEIGRRYMSQSPDDHEDAGDIASGRRQYRKMIEDYCQCVKYNRWPGFDDTDESSATGWTLVTPDVWMEQRRMFATKYNFAPAEPEEQETEQENFDTPP
jgi:hypothetical protein